MTTATQNETTEKLVSLPAMGHELAILSRDLTESEKRGDRLAAEVGHRDFIISELTRKLAESEAALKIAERSRDDLGDLCGSLPFATVEAIFCQECEEDDALRAGVDQPCASCIEAAEGGES